MRTGLRGTLRPMACGVGCFVAVVGLDWLAQVAVGHGCFLPHWVPALVLGLAATTVAFVAENMKK